MFMGGACPAAPGGLSAEQYERIQQNKRKALERLQSNRVDTPNEARKVCRDDFSSFPSSSQPQSFSSIPSSAPPVSSSPSTFMSQQSQTTTYPPTLPQYSKQTLMKENYPPSSSSYAPSFSLSSTTASSSSACGRPAVSFADSRRSTLQSLSSAPFRPPQLPKPATPNPTPNPTPSFSTSTPCSSSSTTWSRNVSPAASCPASPSWQQPGSVRPPTSSTPSSQSSTFQPSQTFSTQARQPQPTTYTQQTLSPASFASPRPQKTSPVRPNSISSSFPQPSQTQTFQTQNFQTQPSQTQTFQTQIQPSQTQPFQTQPSQTQTFQTQSFQTQPSLVRPPYPYSNSPGTSFSTHTSTVTTNACPNPSFASSCAPSSRFSTSPQVSSSVNPSLAFSPSYSSNSPPASPSSWNPRPTLSYMSTTSTSTPSSSVALSQPCRGGSSSSQPSSTTPYSANRATVPFSSSQVPSQIPTPTLSQIPNSSTSSYKQPINQPASFAPSTVSMSQNSLPSTPISRATPASSFAASFSSSTTGGTFSSSGPSSCSSCVSGPRSSFSSCTSSSSSPCVSAMGSQSRNFAAPSPSFSQSPSCGTNSFSRVLSTATSTSSFPAPSQTPSQTPSQVSSTWKPSQQTMSHQVSSSHLQPPSQPNSGFQKQSNAPIVSSQQTPYPKPLSPSHDLTIRSQAPIQSQANSVGGITWGQSQNMNPTQIPLPPQSQTAFSSTQPSTSCRFPISSSNAFSEFDDISEADLLPLPFVIETARSPHSPLPHQATTLPASPNRCDSLQKPQTPPIGSQSVNCLSVPHNPKYSDSVRSGSPNTSPQRCEKSASPQRLQATHTPTKQLSPSLLFSEQPTQMSPNQNSNQILSTQPTRPVSEYPKIPSSQTAFSQTQPSVQPVAPQQSSSYASNASQPIQAQSSNFQAPSTLASALCTARGIPQASSTLTASSTAQNIPQQVRPLQPEPIAVEIDDEVLTCGNLNDQAFADEFPDPPFQFDGIMPSQPTRCPQFQNDLEKFSNFQHAKPAASRFPSVPESDALTQATSSTTFHNFASGSACVKPAPSTANQPQQSFQSLPTSTSSNQSITHSTSNSYRTASGYEFAQPKQPANFASPPRPLTSVENRTVQEKVSPSFPFASKSSPAVERATQPSFQSSFQQSHREFETETSHPIPSSTSKTAPKQTKPRAPPRKRKDAAGESGMPATAKPRAKKSRKQPAAELPQDDEAQDDEARDTSEDMRTVEAGGAGRGGGGSDTMAYSVLDWLHPERLRDMNGRPLGHPEYDPRTLYIPHEAWNTMPPAQVQYWKIKQTNFDLVLLFKIGKFYELFETDAHIGVRQLGLSYMTGKQQTRPHSGFPEQAYEKYTQQLVQLGYRVGRVEQMENPKMLAARNTTENKRDKAVKRELVSIVSRGTMTEPALLPNEEACYLLALWETKTSPAAFGICFVDTSTGCFTVGQFLDDKAKTHLQTLLAQIRPEEVVYSKANLTQDTLALAKQGASPKALFTDISAECWSPERTLMEMKNKAYFTMTSTDLGQRDPRSGFPMLIAEMAHRQEVVALSALGGCVAYLKRLMLDVEILSQARFRSYDPRAEADFLVIDGASLKNLDILVNDEGTTSGTLLHHLDHTSTAFGKRMLRRWITRPLGQVSAIEDRLDAVEDLGMCHRLDAIISDLKKLPDLERDLSRIHAYGIGKDKGAIMYCSTGAKKISLFLGVIQGFRKAQSIIDMFAGVPLKSQRLSQIITSSARGGVFPDLEDALQFFETAFDHQQAKEAGHITPFHGVDIEFDEAEEAVRELERRLEEHLQEQRLYFQDPSIQYGQKGNEKYQIEIPLTTLARTNIPCEYQAMSNTTKVKRFWTPQIRCLLPALENAQEQKEMLTKECTRQMFGKFCSLFQQWTTAAACLAELDCLISLALCSKRQAFSTRPIFETSSAQPLVEIRHGIHVGLTQLAREFVPNDIVLGAAENPERFMLVTGPNMGGKSTLLRQTCILVIMAHLGCLVPASFCRLSPVDRIFTRVGANDRIMQGRSTFLVELEETSSILRDATPRSLVILDELGRGTSTFDGSAIAFAVVEHILRSGCLALFATHYHTLVQEFANEPAVGMFHMAYKLSSAEEAHEPEWGHLQQSVGPTLTFLYKFTRGACPQSFGMNVAAIAGLAPSVVNSAITKSREMEEAFQRKRNKVGALREIWAAMHSFQALQALRHLQPHVRQIVG